VTPAAEARAEGFEVEMARMAMLLDGNAAAPGQLFLSG